MLKEMRSRLERLNGKREQALQTAARHAAMAGAAERDRETATKALEVIKVVALETQRQLEYHLSELATLALHEVFGHGSYKLSVVFTERRGKTECDLSFVRGDGEPVDPMTAAGGGAVDVAAFALRLSLFTLGRKGRRVMVLDEPFRFLSMDLQPKAADLLRQLSKRLGIQFIIVTHSQMLAEGADVCFSISQDKKGISHVTR